MPRSIPLYHPVHNSVSAVEVDPPQWNLPVIGIDECANNQTVAALGRDLCRRRLAAMAMPVWQQLHARADGKQTLFLGNSNSTIREKFDIGKPVKGHSWTDREVVWVLLTHFLSTDTLVLLTENRELDSGGLRLTMNEVIAPALEAPSFGSLSLTVLARKHSTNWQRFSQLAVEFFLHQPMSRQYNYVEL